MSTPEPQPTLRALLARTELALRLASDPSELARDALDAPLRWVHSSDLADPTPFLADDVLLLTTGTQFVGSVTASPLSLAQADAEEYVARLRARGVRGLGFGTEVVRDGIPSELVDACRAAGLPLFEVPYGTPFIALARANAEAIAAQAYARRTWALSAQRAISLAALRPDGLAATVTELAKQLSAWVGLYDAAGVLTHSFPEGGPDEHVQDALSNEVGVVLRRGARAASTFDMGGERITMQTLGRGGHLRGLLAIAGAELDLEGRSVVTSVIAMAGLALEQNVGIRRARAALRAGLVQSLRGGEAGLARRVSREVWGQLPASPVVVAVARVAHARLDAAVEWLEAQASDTRGELFHGRATDGHVIVVPAAATPVVTSFAELFDAAVGCSEPVDYARFESGYDQAVVASRGAAAGSTIHFGEAATRGVLSALTTPEARTLAASSLAPLQGHDGTHGTALVATIQTWLEHDARIDETAQALGVHRHTVRARIAQAQQTLGRDLNAFPVRAELWAALVATRPG